jgi:hypothetical protein
VNPRERRLGENEVLYREVNERVLELQEDFGLADERVEFVCECGNIECSDRISLNIREYEHVRDHPARFAVKPGHEIEDVEDVVEEHDGYVIVEKTGGGAELAAEEDPRS